MNEPLKIFGVKRDGNIPLSDDCQTLFWTSVKIPRLPHEILFIPIGDLHIGSSMFSSSAWDYLKREIVSLMKHHDTIFMGMGDYSEALSTTDRKAIERELRVQTIRDIGKTKLIPEDRQVIEQLEFAKGRFLCFLDGNHKWTYATGQSNAEVIANALGAKYASCSTLCVLKFIGYNEWGIRKDIYARHMMPGGGRTAGASLLQLDKMANIVDADIYCMGHTHNLANTDMPRLRATPNRQTSTYELKQEQKIFISTGSTMTGYRVNEPSYVCKAAYRPAAIGFNYVKLRFYTKTHRRPTGRVSVMQCHMSRHSL